MKRLWLFVSFVALTLALVLPSACGKPGTGNEKGKETVADSGSPDGGSSEQGQDTATPDNGGGETATPDNGGGETATPDQGGETTTPDNGGETTTPDAGNPETPPEPPPTACNNTPATPPAGALCEITAGDDKKLFQANLLTPQGLLAQGQLLVDAQGKIACVGCDCSAKAAGATKISCPNGVLSAGLINAHDHIGWTLQSPKSHGDERYEHRHDWRKGKEGHTKISAGASDTSREAAAWGEIRMMMSGATSIVGSGGTSALIRNLDRDRGGIPGSLDYSTFPLGDSGGNKVTSGCTSYKIDKASDLAKHTAYFPHVSEGVDLAAHNEFVCVSSDQNGGQNLVLPKSAFIHAIGLKAPDVGLMAAGRTSLVWSARTNVDLYGHTALAPMYDRMGVVIALGTDWTPSGSMNMLRELECVDYLNQQHFNKYFSDQKIHEMVTYNGARASHTDQHIGLLKEGLLADIALFDGTTNKSYRAVLKAKAQDVKLVLVQGKPLYGDANLIDKIVASSSSKCEAIDVCGTQKQLCIKDESFSTRVNDFASLKSHLQGKGTTPYPLFFCNTPTNEPSCVPFRKGEYGQSKADDKDGDGVSDSKDNCPSMFNPIRPMDNGKQADHDNDGKGDVCDPCPLNPNTTTCKAPDPNDRDGDKITDIKDNCPTHANPQQEDRDKDGVGDACDACPDDPNPNGQKCPVKAVSIYDIKQKKVAAGAEVKLQNVLVTAIDARQQRMTLQHTSSDPGYKGADYSGIMVFFSGGTVSIPSSLKAGDRVTLVGVVNDYKSSSMTASQRQLEKVSSLQVTPGTETPPAPVVVKPADVNGPTASRAEALEGVIIELQNVEVTSANPDGSRDFQTFSVADPANKTAAIPVNALYDTVSYTGSKRCYWDANKSSGDDSYCLGSDKCQCPSAPCTTGTNGKCYPSGGSPSPDSRTVGDKFQHVRGVLIYTFNVYGIFPRDASDLKK